MFKIQNVQNIGVEKLFRYFEMRNTRYERRDTIDEKIESIIRVNYAKQSQYANLRPEIRNTKPEIRNGQNGG